MAMDENESFYCLEGLDRDHGADAQHGKARWTRKLETKKEPPKGAAAPADAPSALRPSTAPAEPATTPAARAAAARHRPGFACALCSPYSCCHARGDERTLVQMDPASQYLSLIHI